LGQWLSNVMLNSQLNHIYLDQGKIAKIVPGDAPISDRVNSWNANGLLMLPTMKDFHVHLDKQFPTNQWVSRPRVSSILEQFRLEKQLLSPLKSGQKDRARQTLDQMLNFGTTSIRVHVDIDPEIGLSHLETIMQLKEEYKNKIEMEIVAFPQQGLLRSSSGLLIKQAMKEGATIVGGVDPGGVDRDVEGCLHAIFDIGTEFGAEVDIHLHDPGDLGMYTIERIADYTELAGMQGRVTISHAYCLGEINEHASAEIAHRLADQKISVITSVPIDSTMPRVEQLTSIGVNVFLGTDHTGLDAWTPFGCADLLSRGRRLAEINRWNDDERLRAVYPYLSSSLQFQEGDRADFMLIDALNPEHAIAAAPPRDIVAVQGVPVAGRKLHEAWN
jgi:cytosine/adenosine deaminase-related metal-dependent hydrolase